MLALRIAAILAVLATAAGIILYLLTTIGSICASHFRYLNTP
jgi:hypothetical protein